MPINFAREPTNASSLIQNGLGRLALRENPLSERGVDLGALNASQPHPVYDLRADTIANGGGLETATPSGIRSLVRDANGDAVATAEVQLDASGTATLLTNMNYGSYVGATADALTKI